MYRKGFPDFYLKFSLDSDSVISKELDVAQRATKSGKAKIDGKEIVLRDKNVKKDPDYVDREEEEREKAYAKSEELLHVLQ
jgi:hypothetical protein